MTLFVLDESSEIASLRHVLSNEVLNKHPDRNSQSDLSDWKVIPVIQMTGRVFIQISLAQFTAHELRIVIMRLGGFRASRALRTEPVAAKFSDK